MMQTLSVVAAAATGVLDHQDRSGRSALHAAAMRNHYEACQLLIEAGINAMLQDYEGNTALHLASMASHAVESVERSPCELIFRKCGRGAIANIPNYQREVPRRRVSGRPTQSWHVRKQIEPGVVQDRK